MSAHVLTGCMLLFAAPSSANSQSAGSESNALGVAQGNAVAPPSQLEEVIANVRAQPLGSGTVDDLALPEDLLRRLSDRILRRSFEDTFRIVVAAQVPSAPAEPAPGPMSTSTSPSPFRSILNVFALVAVCVLTVLGYFAWRARSRRKE